MHAQHEGTARTGASTWFEPGALVDFEAVPSATRVMLASPQTDRHAGWLSWMAWEPGIDIVGGPVTQADRLAESVARHQPDVLLLDSTLLAQLDRPALCCLAHARELRVLLVVEEAGRADVSAMLCHHFHGVLAANCSNWLCLKAIRTVSAGELWLSRKLMADYLSDGAWPMAPSPVPTPREVSQAHSPKALTLRERQVVARLNQGRSNKEIARELGIVEDTVKKHLKSVYAKLGVRRRAMVILQATSGA